MGRKKKVLELRQSCLCSVASDSKIKINRLQTKWYEITFPNLNHLKFQIDSKLFSLWNCSIEPSLYWMPILIWIPACILLGISIITFYSIIQLSLCKLGWKADMMGYKYAFHDNVQIQTLEGQNGPANQGLKISHNFGIFMKQIQFLKPWCTPMRSRTWVGSLFAFV